MKWKKLNGSLVDISIAKYKIDFEGEQGSLFSEEVLDFLYPYWKNDIVLCELPVIGTRMRFDYVNISKRIICETDGFQHTQYSPHFHGGSRSKYLAQIKRDLFKDQIATNNNFIMVRIKPDDLPLTKEWFKKTYDIDL